MITVIGYLVNCFNDPAYPRAVILSDGNLDENPNGGTGKGLISTAISKVRKQCYLDGKTTDFTSNRFAFQNLTVDTQNVLIDDVRYKFDFQDFFSKVTTGYTSEPKGKPLIQFSIKNNPKTIITTNYAVRGTGSSFDRRKYEFEVLPYYGTHRVPEEDFKTFFDSWDVQEWNSFYNFIFHCCQQFHANGGRISEYESDTLELKKVIVALGAAFVDFADDLPRGEALVVSELIKDYKALFSEKKATEISPRAFGGKMTTYCECRGLKLERDKKNSVVTYKIIDLDDIYFD